MHRKFNLPLLILAAVASVIFAPPAQAQKEITVNSFKSSSLWPIWAAQHQGFFAAHGLAIKNVYTASSASQMIGLIKGDFELVSTALDNVIAYDEGQGSPDAPKNADLVVFLGGNNGALSLVGRPEIKSAKDLKGRDLAVDALATGFAFVLQDLLARDGLAPNDYKLVAFGNTGARWQALQKNEASAGLLTPPVTQAAIAQGYTDLGDAAKVLGGYQGTVVAARRDWVQGNADSVTAFIRAYREGLAWLLAPANKQAATAIMVEEIAGTTPAAAEETYGLMVADPRGFDPGGKIDDAGAKRVLDLRRRYGPQGKPTADIGRFVDESYFARAAKP